jgi:hypothetical protein
LPTAELNTLILEHFGIVAFKDPVVWVLLGTMVQIEKRFQTKQSLMAGADWSV